MTTRRKTVQKHHISYEPEVVVAVYKGEHWILTQLQRRKRISRGFVKAIKAWLALHEDEAKELDTDGPEATGKG